MVVFKAGLDSSAVEEYKAMCWAVGINIRTTAKDGPATRAAGNAADAAAEGSGKSEGRLGPLDAMKGVLQR
jgi:hypothetical protein